MNTRMTLAAIGVSAALLAIPAIGFAATTSTPTSPTPATCPYHTANSDRLHLGDADHARLHAEHMAGGGMMGSGMGWGPGARS